MKEIETKCGEAIIVGDVGVEGGMLVYGKKPSCPWRG